MEKSGLQNTGSLICPLTQHCAVDICYTNILSITDFERKRVRIGDLGQWCSLTDS